MFAIEHSLAITVFAELEDQMCMFVAFQAGKASGAAMKSAMYGIESFRAKLEFVNRFTRIFLDGKPDMIDRWEKVHSALGKANSWRNQIVHQSKRVFPKSTPGRRVVLVSPVVRPSSGHAAKVKAVTTGEPAPDDAIGVRNIVEARLLASEARNRLGSVWGLMQKGRDVYEGHPPLKAPKLEELVKEYRRSARANLV